MRMELYSQLARISSQMMSTTYEWERHKTCADYAIHMLLFVMANSLDVNARPGAEVKKCIIYLTSLGYNDSKMHPDPKHDLQQTLTTSPS